jgi:hypothetical protein
MVEALAAAASNNSAKSISPPTPASVSTTLRCAAVNSRAPFAPPVGVKPSAPMLSLPAAGSRRTAFLRLARVCAPLCRCATVTQPERVSSRAAFAARACPNSRAASRSVVEPSAAAICSSLPLTVAARRSGRRASSSRPSGVIETTWSMPELRPAGSAAFNTSPHGAA